MRGIDPSVARNQAKVALIEKTENTFEAIAREWFAKREPVWKKS